MAAGSNPTQSLKREREMDDGALMPPTQISKRNHEGNDASPGVEPRKLLELHVKDTNGMWWPMPRDLSDRPQWMYHRLRQNASAQNPHQLGTKHQNC